jgi:hypothetical protein
MESQSVTPAPTSPAYLKWGIGVGVLVLLVVGAYFLFVKKGSAAPRTGARTSPTGSTPGDTQTRLERLQADVDTLKLVRHPLARRYRMKVSYPGATTFTTTWVARNPGDPDISDNSVFPHQLRIVVDPGAPFGPGAPFPTSTPWFHGVFRVFVNSPGGAPNINFSDGAFIAFGWDRRGGGGGIRFTFNSNHWTAFAESGGTRMTTAVSGPTCREISGAPYGVAHNVCEATLPWGTWKGAAPLYFSGFAELYGLGTLGGNQLESDDVSGPRVLDFVTSLPTTGYTTTEKVIAEL